MARRASVEDRLARIVAAATTSFGRLGYRRTRMAEVAKAAGLSAGAIYSYVESKEALFHLVFVRAFRPVSDATPSLPLVAPPFEETLQLIGEGLRNAAPTPVLRGAVRGAEPADVRAELAAVVTERYELIERLWPVLAVIERCAVDLPALEELYFQRGRPGHIQQLTRYLEQRASEGHLRAMPDTSIAARIVTEVVTWFAWHRREDRDAGVYDEHLVLPTIVEFVTDALIEPA